MPRNTPEQAEARRDQITRAAWRCFSRDGFHVTSMDDVIREAGLSAGAVYRYFPGKAALVHGAVEAVFRMTRAAFDELFAAGTPPADPAAAVSRVVQHIEDSSERKGVDLSRIAVSAWSEALRDPALAELAGELHAHIRTSFAELVVAWRDSGVLSPDVDAGQVAAAVNSLVQGFLLQRALLGDVTATDYASGVAGLLGRPPAVRPHAP